MSVKKMKRGGIHAWMIDQLMYMSGARTPVEAMGVAMQLNAENQHPGKVRQDVLIRLGHGLANVFVKGLIE